MRCPNHLCVNYDESDASRPPTMDCNASASSTRTWLRSAQALNQKVTFFYKPHFFQHSQKSQCFSKKTLIYFDNFWSFDDVFLFILLSLIMEQNTMSLKLLYLTINTFAIPKCSHNVEPSIRFQPIKMKYFLFDNLLLSVGKHLHSRMRNSSLWTLLGVGGWFGVSRKPQVFLTTSN